MLRRYPHRILHNELKFHSYKMMMLKQLTERDYVQSKEFCGRMMAILTENANAMIRMSDEVHFHLDVCEYVNKQNYW